VTQPVLKVQTDASTAIASANTWSASSVVQQANQFFTKGTATDLELFVISSSLAGTASANSVTPTLVGSATSAFSTTASVSPDKGTLAGVGQANISTHAHFAQLSYPYYRLLYTPTGASNFTGSVVSVAVFSGYQDSLDVSDN
jgi:hypothetical protein